MADQREEEAMSLEAPLQSIIPDTIIEENEDGESWEGQEDEEDGENSELVVLDPSHPLMERVQAALREQLNKQNEKLEIELREQRETLKVAQKSREEIGVELYGIQQQLARQQMMIEKEQDNHSTMVQLRQQKDHTLSDVKNMYQRMQEQLKEEQDHATNLRAEMENAGLRLKYLNEAHETVKQDIALTVRATEKAVVDVSKAQKDKLKQDYYVDQLTREIDRLEEKVALTNSQSSAQAQNTKAMKETLAEATMELETLCLEKRKLMHQWNNSLIGMRRRDEAYSAMITARNIQQQEVHSKYTELDNYKKSIVKEQEQNEQLTLLLRKIQTDITHIKHLITQSEAKIESLNKDYMTYTRVLQETEQSLTSVTGEVTMKKNELTALRTQTEREAQEKRRLEDSIMDNMMQALTMDKSTQYSQKSLEKLRKSIQELEIALANVENDISGVLLETSSIDSLIKRLQVTLDEFNSAIEQQNIDINKSEAEINRNNALIERKQTQIDQMNKKIEAKLNMAAGGGENLGPWELRIDELQKQISDSMEECSKMQQHWLRQQNDLVKRTNEIDVLLRETDDLQKKELILSQKKIRLDGELEGEEKQFTDITHSIESLQKEMVRLSTLITEKKGEHYKLEQNNTLLEKDFISALKESELEFIQLQTKLDSLHEEKERLLNSLVEGEHQIMLWERKIKLAKEMKDSVDSETGQAEIKATKAEIHRMQVRYSQLLRQQETMIQEMEKAIYRRDTIIQRSDAQSKSGKTDTTQGYLKRKIIDTGRKVKSAQKDVISCEKSIESALQIQTQLVNEIQVRTSTSHETKDSIDTLQLQLHEQEQAKQMAKYELLSTQSQVKNLTAAKENKYRLLHKSSDTRLAEMMRQKEKLQSLWSVVQKLERESPQTHLLSTLSSQMMSKLKKIQHTSGIDDETV